MNREKFLKVLPAVLFLPAIIAACKGTNEINKAQPEQSVGGPCEDCELLFVDLPSTIASHAIINNSLEQGDLLHISGIVYKNDGLTPAESIILYVYHTNTDGYYAPGSGQNPASKRHGRLRGWMKTNAKGEYSFITIKPGVYPDRSMPAHIHPIIKEAGKSVYYIDDYVFEGEHKVDNTYIVNQAKRCGSGIIQLSKDMNGIWTGKRDIILGLNIPHYI